MNLLEIEALHKTFILHLRGGLRLHALRNVHLTLEEGECVVITGASGAGKSTLLRTIYGNYRGDGGAVRVRAGSEMVDMLNSTPRRITALRRDHMAYASQFLRVIPRVPTLDLVAQVLLDQGIDPSEAEDRARSLLWQLNLPASLHALPPATFSGGERQRVNIARAFVGNHPLILLDEPTASLDLENTMVVRELILSAKAAGRGILAIFHDPDFVAQVADRTYSISFQAEICG
ncbi:MAG: phosphonate C-P lyase system protein PhnL [Acidithiobacillus sp.]